MSTTKPTDDLEAVRVVVDALKDFKDNAEQQRILRWAAEKLGLPQPFAAGAGSHALQQIPVPAVQPNLPQAAQPSEGHQGDAKLAVGQTVDIKSFVAAKGPKNDVQFAATVAYYYQFEAPQAERKTSINKDDLQDACRKAGRDRLINPGQTLRNAHMLGLLDKAGEAGQFSVNTVGENLVAMTLPGDGNSPPTPTKKRARKAAQKTPAKGRQGSKSKKA